LSAIKGKGHTWVGLMGWISEYQGEKTGRVFRQNIKTHTCEDKEKRMSPSSLGNGGLFITAVKLNSLCDLMGLKLNAT
jgi:hypothetical protein